MKTNKTKWMIEVSMLSAIAIVLMLIEFPLPFIAPPFYKLDFSEIPVLIGTFAIGPVAGVVIEIIKVLLNLLINGTITGGIGELGNLLVGIMFVFPAGLIYKYKKTKQGAVLGLVLGSVLMIIASSFVNAYLLIPAYGKALSMPIDSFIEMGKLIHPSINSLWHLVVLCVVPFNAIKVIIDSFVVMLIYKPLKPILKVK